MNTKQQDSIQLSNRKSYLYKLSNSLESNYIWNHLEEGKYKELFYISSLINVAYKLEKIQGYREVYPEIPDDMRVLNTLD